MSSGADKTSADAWPLRPPIKLPLADGEPHPCSYLPGREARTRAFAIDRMPPLLYHAFMDAGFRRSGQLVYQPSCLGCRACVPIRIPVTRFEPSKSHRRVLRRNRDLAVQVEDDPVPDDERFSLYRRYVREWHGAPNIADGPDARASFEEFLYRSPVRTIEFAYRRPGTGELLAVGLCDVCEASLSSVYFYFDPLEARRSLGTFGLLREIEFAGASGIPHYYLGYWIADAPTMSYKAQFRPHELLGADGAWRAGDEMYGKR